jgi:hypothetical protein
MLEGKEVEGKIGEIGEYYVDLNDKGEIEVAVSLKIDLVKEAKKLAASTGTPIDDTAIAWLEKLMGR